ncbi:phage tail length tape measure family protein [Mesorhizobium sp. Pch-S]|uniref:phage tail length tape measure family protein n=1 Tax=Mesorhizobium sp. Pch-S TaxID=2082387 RepID=UPI0010124B02|nr:phage tail length tape measure family protein [Mesorhizobium sp. Pch-S]QAZ46145.1 hypothetical protein C1M53_27675 [Mesorhizobium sp. Pch-S]
MAIEAERLLAIFEARFTSLEKSLEKARTNANKAFGDIEASGTRAEDALSKVGEKGLPGIDRASKSVAAMKGNTANLAAQLNDIGVQLAGGQSPFLIAIQQGTQINQALGPTGARGAVAALGGAFMSLLNPVGLATLAIIAGGGYAAQYFLEIISGGEKSAETLKNEAELIQRVVNKWGDALPALQAYAKEREALADKKDLEEATNIGKDNAFEKTREQVDGLRADLALLIGDLGSFAGQETQVARLQDAFSILQQRIESQTATAEDAKRVQTVLADVLSGTGVPAAGSLADEFSRLAQEIAKASAKAFEFQSQQDGRIRASTKGGPARYQSGQIDLPETAPTPDRTPNREDVFAEQDRYRERAARRGARGQRLNAGQRTDEDLRAVKDRTEALRQEAAMIGLSFQEQERRRMALDLEQEALKRLREEAARKGQKDLESIRLSPDQVAKINAVSEAYAQQAEVLRQVRERQQEAEQASGEFYDTFKNGAIDAITGARKLSDVLKELGTRFASMLLNSGFDMLFKPKSGNSSGGSFGSVFDLIGKFITGSFANGTSSAPGGLAVVGERGRELVNLPRGSQVVPNDITEKLIGGDGGGSPIYIGGPTINVDARNAQPGVGEEVRRAVKDATGNMTQLVRNALREMKVKGMKP